jgi:hypothetical protein
MIVLKCSSSGCDGVLRIGLLSFYGIFNLQLECPCCGKTRFLTEDGSTPQWAVLDHNLNPVTVDEFKRNRAATRMMLDPSFQDLLAARRRAFILGTKKPTIPKM